MTLKKLLTILGAVLLFVLLVMWAIASGLFSRWLGNKVDFAGKKIDEKTSYEIIKKVEDTARAMVSSYTADKLVYEQYNDSDSREKQSWAEQAKMRANKTAATYNNYILENSFVWADNVPTDINKELEYLK